MQEWTISTLQPEPEKKNRELMTPFFGFTSFQGLAQSGGLMHDEMGGACTGCNRLVSSRNAVIPVMVSLHRDLGRSRLLGAPLQRLVTFSLFNTIKLWKLRICVSTNRLPYHSYQLSCFTLPSPYETGSFRLNTI